MNNKLEYVTSSNYRNLDIKEVILPVGSFEQHGPHGVLATDYLIAKRISEMLSKETGIWLLPPIVYGCSSVHLGHSGTISIKNENFYMYLTDIIESLYLSKVEKVYVINGHGGNISTLLKVKENFEGKINVEILNWWIIGRKLEMFTKLEGHHAGSEETSVLMTICENCVDKNKFEDTEVIEYNPYMVTSIDDLTKTGSIGIVTTASRERGEEYLEKLIRVIIDEYM